MIENVYSNSSETDVADDEEEDTTVFFCSSTACKYLLFHLRMSGAWLGKEF